MSKIHLEIVSGEGFLTFCDPFEFPISDYRNRTVQIDGLNKDDEMSKSNGSGKSSLLEAISWGWYGELSRKNRYKDEVIYSRNGVKAKAATVITNFSTNGKSYKTVRKVEWKKSPELSLYEESNKEILKGSTYQTKQNHLEELLGMNFTAFQCCEMFGRDFMSFPDLKPSERAKNLTDIKNLDQWVAASKYCTDEAKAFQFSIVEETEKLRTIEGRISQLRETNYKSRIKEFEETRKKEIQEIENNEKTVKSELETLAKDQENKISQLETRIEAYEEDQEKNDELLSELPDLEKRRKESEKELYTLNTNKEILRQRLKGINQEIVNFQSLGVGSCPTCKQKITGPHLKKEIDNLRSDFSEIELQMKEIDPKVLEALQRTKDIEIEIKILRSKEAKSWELIDLIRDAKSAVLSLRKSPEEQRYRTTLENLKDRLEALEASENPYEKQEEERKRLLFSLVGQSKTAKHTIEEWSEDSVYLQFWTEGFKKIRMALFSTMINRFQDYAQNHLNQYSSELQILFSTERETRSGTIKDEFDIIITDSSGTALSYEMYSGGEKQKIRLSISLALAQMIRDDCGKDFNFICFDEPNDALDDVGKESNFDVFTKLASEGRAVLCTDHDSTFKDKFNDTVTVVKEGDKSHIQME